MSARSTSPFVLSKSRRGTSATASKDGEFSAALALAIAITSAVFLLTPAIAGAQDVNAARAAFERGVTALDEGRFADAANALEESRRLRAAPVVDYNLGLAYRGAGRLLDAIAAFERYVANPGRNARADEVAAVNQALATLRASIVTLRIDLDPQGTEVHVDGRAVVLSSGAVQLDPGEHVIEGLAPGRRSFREQRRFATGERVSMTIRLDAAPAASARLVVEPSVASAVVRVDGRVMPAGNVDIAAPPGPHHLAITAPGYAPYERDVTVPANGTLRVDAALSRPLAPWVLPVAIAGGALVIAGVVITAVVASNPGTAPPYVPSLGVVSE